MALEARRQGNEYLYDKERAVRESEHDEYRKLAPSLTSGDSLFDSIAQGLTEKGLGNYDHETVRGEVVSHMRNNPNTLSGICRFDLVKAIYGDKYNRWKQYVNYMSQYGHPGDHVCLKACCELYKVRIKV